MVIVIGNITVGGTGKTPIVERFARELIKRGRKVAILSRGYKRKESGIIHKIVALFDAQAAAPTVVSDGSGKVLCDWKRAGDEPAMLAHNVPQAVVVVDKNRVKAGAYAIRKFGVDTILLDDGFQYLSLKSRLKIVLVDQNNPFGNGSMLPRGVLREPLKALRRADYIFITKSDGTPSEELLSLLKLYAPKLTPIVCAHQPKFLRALNPSDENETQPLSLLKGARILAFSGIAMPESFERMIKECGGELVRSMHYADHYAYDAEDIEQIIKTAEGSSATMILTTEKDAVRLPRLNTHLPCYYLRMEVEILSGEKDFSKAMESICFPVEKYINSGLTPPIF